MNDWNITEITYPDLVIEVHRYDDPDTFRFFTLLPRPVDHDTMNFHPFAVSREEMGPNYIESKRAQVSAEAAVPVRELMTRLGYQTLRMDQLPDNVQRWVTHSQCPIEWHRGLDAKDPELMKRVMVWVLGDMP